MEIKGETFITIGVFFTALVVGVNIYFTMLVEVDNYVEEYGVPPTLVGPDLNVMLLTILGLAAIIIVVIASLSRKKEKEEGKE